VAEEEEDDAEEEMEMEMMEDSGEEDESLRCRERADDRCARFATLTLLLSRA
jgi:hypothetical protein